MAVARAQNQIGWGPQSTPNLSGATIQTEPHAMSAPSRGSLTSISQIQASWLPSTGVETGGSSITSYILQIKSASGDWQSLVGSASPYTLTQYTTYDNITAGTAYEFRVAAVNIHGTGAFSSSVSITASGPPDAMTQLSVVKSLTDTSKLVISWDAPNSNYETITAYEVLFQQSDGSYSANSA